MGQSCNEKGDLNHNRWLAGAFRDRRYIWVHDGPLFWSLAQCLKQMGGGNHLAPCQKWGHAYLQANALKNGNS